MKKNFLVISIVAILAAWMPISPWAKPSIAGSFNPITVTDQASTAPLANPVPSSFQPRYISGFGSDASFTVFFEDRDAEYKISYASTTIGPTGFPASATASNITDTHFLVKDWPINVDGTDYVYRAWGSVGNNPQHNFYVSNDLTNWTLVSTFIIPNAPSFTDAHGYVYYGFHDVVLLNGTYYAFAESNQSQTMLVRSTNGDDVWEAFASIGGRPGWGPLELPAGVSYGWTPSGSFVDLGYDRGYGKIYVDPRDSSFYLAVNTAATASLPPADLEAAFINPTNWTWHDGTTGPAANPILSETGEHDLRECWVVPNTNPDADWVIIYDADFGSSDGGKALGYATLTPPAPPPDIVWVDDDYCELCANDSHIWGYDAFDNIQDGIAAVADGGTVNVAAGDYNEQVVIDKSLILLGAKANVDPRGGAWGSGQSVINPGSGNTGIDIMASDVTVNGFEVTGAQYGIYIGSSSVSNIFVSYNDLHHNSKYGLQAIGLDADISYINISMNYMHYNGRNGLKLVDVTDCTIASNEFAYNGFGPEATYPEYQYGVFLEDERYNAPIYNPCIRNTFVGNIFHDNNLGAINMEAMGNATSDYWDSTEFLEGTVVHNNFFFGDSTVCGINVSNDYKDDGSQNGFGPIAIIDATCNWWGHLSGPYHDFDNPYGKGNKVSDEVDFQPWLLTQEGLCYGYPEVADCAESAKNHGQFVKCVVQFAKELVKENIITKKEKGEIVSAAARADIP